MCKHFLNNLRDLLIIVIFLFLITFWGVKSVLNKIVSRMGKDSVLIKNTGYLYYKNI